MKLYIFYRKDPVDGSLTSVIVAENLEDAQLMCVNNDMGFNPEAYIELDCEKINRTALAIEGTNIVSSLLANNDNLKEI